MWFLMLACYGGSDPDKDSGRDTADADTDTDTDADSDSDSDSDRDADFCDEALSTAPGEGPGCYASSLSCGDSVLATTEGGSSNFVGDDYTHFYCFVNIDENDYDGTERVYWIDLDPDVYATASLKAPCGEMSLAAMVWTSDDECPDGSGVSVCEGEEDADGGSVTFGGYSGNNTWIVVVDTPTPDAYNFRLSLDCE